VSADGFISGGRVVMLKEGEEQTINIALAPAPAVALAETAPAPVAETKPEPADKAEPWPWVALGIGGAGLAVGTVTGVMFLGLHGDLSEECPTGECEPANDAEKARLEDDLSQYNTLGTISGISFAIGAAGIGTGLVLLFTSQKDESASSARLTPLVGPGFVGVRGRL
jgi:hypothetical protein